MLDLTCEIEREAIWFSFADVLQSDLDKVKEYHNSHSIRKSRHAVVSGVPDVMYFLPEEFGKVDCLKEVLPQKIIELENRLERGDDTDTIWEDYFEYVMTNNGLSYPSSIPEAGVISKARPVCQRQCGVEKEQFLCCSKIVV